ncbi:MAG: hypothetical protein WCK10_03960 [Candidatus Staskawiczbacteria bacterium]
MIYYILSLLIGYSIGRLGHIIGGDIIWIPHHWIFGIIIMIVPLFFRKVSRKIILLVILFGLGVFISDFKDFLTLEIFGADNVFKAFFGE